MTQRRPRTLLLVGLLGAGLSLAAPTPAQKARTQKPEQAQNAQTFTNPVINEDFPDPFILRVGNSYYAYATNSGGVDVPVMKSSDLVHWQSLGDALGGLPGWAEGGNTWAPEVMAVKGGYTMYYTARHSASGRQCIGVATSTSPQGPFTDKSSKPLVCQLDLGGSIDPSPFVDTDGTRYLYWKNDGNCCNIYTTLWVQKLSADGKTLQGKPTGLFSNAQLWEGNVIEAPSVHKHGGKYYLFYSASDYASDLYAVGYAVGSSPLGPFKKKSLDEPWLATKGKVAGPGGEGVITDGKGNTWMYYHAWTQGQVGYNNGGVRKMYLDPLEWKNGVPVLKGPTTGTERAPARL